MNESQVKIAEAVLLIMRAMKAKQEGNQDQVQALMDKATKIVEDTIGTDPQLRIIRELLVIDYSEEENNWGNLDTIIEKAYEYYTQQDMLPFQISMLIQSVHLAFKLGEKDKATLYLDKLKSQLDTVTIEDINTRLPMGIIAPTGDDLLQKWQEEASRLEQMLVEK